LKSQKLTVIFFQTIKTTDYELKG